MVSTFSISTDQPLTSPSSSVAQSEQPCSRKIPLYICLSDHLTVPTDVACAGAVADFLPGCAGRPVSLAELEGLSLFQWSEEDLVGKELGWYLERASLLQGLLLETREEPGDGASVVNAELVRYVGARFEFTALVRN